MALWRLRATVEDRPGFLAVLAASLALRSVNILAVGVHVTEQGAVDDFLVDAPDELTAEQLLAAVERGRGRDAWVARTEARSLVDAPTRAIDLATFLARESLAREVGAREVPARQVGAHESRAREPAAVRTALAELLDARVSWQPDQYEFGFSGTRMWVPAPAGGAWLVERAAPSFTPAEYARAQALLALAAAVSDRTGGPGPAAAVEAAADAAEPAVLLLPDGQELRLRRAEPADQVAVQAMHGRCSAASLHQRYLSGAGTPGDSRVARLLTPARGGTLLAAIPDTGGGRRVVAVATLVGEGVQAEVGLLVEDAWQRRGIGTALLRRILALADQAGFDAVALHTQAANHTVHRMLRRLRVSGRTDRDGALVTVTVPLRPADGLAKATGGSAPAGPA